MNTARAFGTIIDALQHATSSVLDPRKYREALNAAVELCDHYQERDEATISVLLRCQNAFSNMQSDLLMKGPEIDPVVELAGELEEATERQSTQLLLETRTVRTSNTGFNVPVYTWGRDCDLCESDGITWIEPDMETFTQLVADTYDNAEGPVAIRIMKAKEANEFKASFRDRVMEAYEDGNTTGVVI